MFKFPEPEACSGAYLRPTRGALAIAIILTSVVVAMPSAGAQTLTVLHRFTGGADGEYPESGLIRDGKGNLYGTTYDGGAFGFGTVFKLSKTGKLTVLHSFSETGGDGGCPYYGALLRDAAGNLYGTAYAGGDASYGIIFKLDASGTETVLYSFKGAPDGGGPYGGLVRDAAGNFYGTTSLGGSGNGTVFKLDTNGRESVLYGFAGGADGSLPTASLVLDPAGNFYGTTYQGGSYTCNPLEGCGTVFRLDTAYKLTILHTFNGGKDGAGPIAGLVRDKAGSLYGTTYQGASGRGAVFKVNKNGKETVLHRFRGKPDGGLPGAGLIRDGRGNLYGTTSEGGTGSGTIFELDSKGKETVLYEFSGPDGRHPYGSLFRDSVGNLYGTATGGGVGHGVVFKLTP
jgi:uncharacterized repeat protein (TIGR03803 family)